jgi:uncharacterized membrane protein YhdT
MTEPLATESESLLDAQEKTHSLRRSLGFFVSSLWWGSLTTIGFVVVPLLFVWVSPKALAGVVAGQMFVGVSWLNALAPLVLWLLARSMRPWRVVSPMGLVSEASEISEISTHPTRQLWRLTLWALGASVVLAAWMLAIVIPHITQGIDRPLWHGLGSLTYALMWIVTSAVMLKSRQFWS